MIQFLIYLFESGMCLTLLFLVYYLFLRKETYFTFNRIYLISILIFSLLFPLIQLNLSFPKSNVLESQVKEISKFKSYYENIIALTDPDYLQSFTKPFQENKIDEFDETEGVAFSSQNSAILNTLSKENIQNKKTGFWANLNFARILLILYLLGILFFGVRLILLFRWINQTIKKYGSTIENDVIMVKMDEEVPPFSFFRFVFFNREAVSLSGFGQIIAHEKVHINQHHSLDLLLAHTITIFQWFNPFVWLINNAMKTNHEYIADRNVVEQGYELFDYQSLLLKQIISIRSVELVNNFNLINIKKRIAMMTKIKSGIAAQLKALVVIPTAIFIFFFFAEITFVNNLNAQNSISLDNNLSVEDLYGFWQNEKEDTYGKLLNFKTTSFQILENKDSYQEFDYFIPDNILSTSKEYYNESKVSSYISDYSELTMMIVTIDHQRRRQWDEKPVHLVIKNDRLIVEWSKDQVSTYKRIKIKNSLEYFTGNSIEDFEPVSLKYYKLAENPKNTFHILMNKKGQMLLDNELVTIENLQEKLWDKKAQGNPFASWGMIPILVIDARCPMKFVSPLFNRMREMDELKYIISVKPFDEKVPEIFYHNVGIPRMLPPKDAKLIDEEEIKDRGINLIQIDATKKMYDLNYISKILRDGLSVENPRYVMLLKYENETLYKVYLSILDEVYKIVNAKRNKLSMEKFSLYFDDLAKAQQRVIRKAFPMALTERNVDSFEN